MSTTTIYSDFSLADVEGLPPGRARAVLHARWAEALLASVDRGVYPAGIPNIAAAAVHAQLATAYAVLGGQA